MSTLYNVPGTAIVALGGDSPGTPANWLETTSTTLRDSWIVAHGPMNQVDQATFDKWKGFYLSPVLVSAGSVSTGSGTVELGPTSLSALAAIKTALKFPTKIESTLS